MVLLAIALLAAETDVLTGASGWAGAGLLGLVLAWLLFVHLPAKDKRDREKDELLVKVVNEFQTRIDKKSDEYDQREAAKDEKFLAALEKITTRIQEIGSAIATLCKYRTQSDHHPRQTERRE